MTLRQVHRHLAGRAKARQAEFERAAWQAWTTASLTLTAFHKPQKFPKLDQVLPRKRGAIQPMTADQVRSQFAALKAAMKG